MSKKIQAHFKKENQRIIIDSEDVNIGDYIDIASFSLLEEFIDSKLDEKHKNRIIEDFKQSEYFKKILNDKDEFQRQVKTLEEQSKQIAKNAVTEFKASDDYIKIQNELTKVKSDLDNLIKINANNKNDIINEFRFSEEYIKLTNSNKDLESKLKIEQNKIESLIKDFDRQKQEIKSQAISEFKLNDKEYQKLLADNTKSSLALENAYFKSVEKFKNSEDFLKIINELEELRREKNSRRYANSKTLGEELEISCNNYFNDYFQSIDDVSFTKTTKPIGGKKPDFLFSVYKDNSKNDKDLIGTVVLEMKTDNGENKTKNESHYKTLDENRKNFGAEFGVLITELELNTDKDLIIRKVPGYENLFVARPSFFINILILFRLIYKKCEILKDKLNAENVTVEYVNNVIEEFVEYRNNIINNAIKNIKTNLSDINDCADKIKKQADNIINSANTIINSHIRTFENKLEEIVKKLTNGEKKYKKNYEEIKEILD